MVGVAELDVEPFILVSDLNESWEGVLSDEI